MRRMILATLMAYATAFAAGGPAIASDAVAVFGLTIGERLPKPPRQCKETGAAESYVCWVGPPSRLPTGTLGSVKLPDAVLPKWAAYSAVQIALGKDGALDWVSVKPVSSCDFEAMRESIASRFGPATGYQSSPVRRFVWELPNIRIQLDKFDSADMCNARFESPRHAESHRRYVDSLRQRDLARPASP